MGLANSLSGSASRADDAFGQAPIANLEGANPDAVVAWIARRFRQHRVVVTTGFGMEGCALIDLLARHDREWTVHYLDTHFLFPETHQLRDRLEKRYANVRFVNAGTTLTPREQELQHGPELWKSDPDKCCFLRKVEPMRRLVAGADVWVTGLRRSQSQTRSAIRTIEWDWQFDLLKVSPLAYWDRDQVWRYVQSNRVPFNELHDRGYPSIGCTHCTQAVEGTSPGQYTRTGRWAHAVKTECGLHLGTIANSLPMIANEGAGHG